MRARLANRPGASASAAMRVLASWWVAFAAARPTVLSSCGHIVSPLASSMEQRIEPVDSKFLAVFSKDFSEVDVMRSTDAAKKLTRDIGELLAPEMPAKVRYSKIFAKLADLLPDLTMRRVRALHNGEALRVDYDEVVALEKLRAIEEARNEHRQFVAYTNKLAALHAAGRSTLSRKEIEVLSRVASKPAHVRGAGEAAPRRAGPSKSGGRGAARPAARAGAGRMDRARAA